MKAPQFRTNETVLWNGTLWLIKAVRYDYSGNPMYELEPKKKPLFVSEEYIQKFFND